MTSRRFHALLLAGAALGGAAPAIAAQPSPPEASQSEAAQPPLATVPFELYDGRIYLQVGGPGFAPRLFLLDTGAQITHFTSELVAEAGLRTSGSVGITGTGTARIKGSYVAAATLDLGGIRLPVRRGIAAPAEALFGPVYAGSGRRFEGVIGYDLFDAFTVEIDYENRLIRLYDPESFRYRGGGERLPIRIADKKPYVAALIEFSGAAALNAELHLDTGFGGALGFNGNFVEERNLLALAGNTLPSTSRGVGGATPARLGRVQALRLGGYVLPAPLATFALVHGAGVPANSDGRIGGTLLRRFTLTIDYRGGAIFLEPNASFARPIETDMSGMALVSGGPDLAEIVVASVADASAAADAAVLPGDRLLSIDDRGVAQMSLEEVRALLMQEGETRRLILRRDGVEVPVTLTLRRRI